MIVHLRAPALPVTHSMIRLPSRRNPPIDPSWQADYVAGSRQPGSGPWRTGRPGGPSDYRRARRCGGMLPGRHHQPFPGSQRGAAHIDAMPGGSRRTACPTGWHANSTSALRPQARELCFWRQNKPKTMRKYAPPRWNGNFPKTIRGFRRLERHWPGSGNPSPTETSPGPKRLGVFSFPGVLLDEASR